MAKYDPQWDRVLRQLETHYGMYDKVLEQLSQLKALQREINIQQGVMALERNWLA